jgi:hypothetical protein
MTCDTESNPGAADQKAVFPEFGKTDTHVNGNAVAKEMQIGRPEVHNAFAGAVLDARVSNVPFEWSSPIGRHRRLKASRILQLQVLDRAVHRTISPSDYPDGP